MSDLSGKASLDTTDFKAGLSEMNRDIRVIESSFRASAAALGDWSASATGLEQRITSLTAEIAIQQEKVLAVRGEYERVAASQGENSRVAEELQIKLNRETETLGKMQVQLGDAKSSLDNMSQSSETAAAAADDVKTSSAGLGGALRNLQASWTELNSAISVVRIALEEVRKVYDETVGKTVQFASEVRALSRVTGESAVESSRLIVANEALGGSYDELQHAADLAAKRGVAVNTESLAKMADEYVAIKDPVERAQFVVEKFGKAGLDMEKILERGGKAIRDAGIEADRTGKILDDQAVASARAFERELKSVTDEVDGLKIALGSRLLPAIKAVLNGFDLLLTANTTYLGALARGESVVQAGQDAIAALRDRYVEIKSAEQDAADGADGLAVSTTDMSARVDDATLALANARKALDDVATAQNGVKIATDQAAEAMQILNAALAGPIKRENESYAESQDKLRQKAADLEEQIAKLLRTQGRAYGPSADLAKIQLEQAVAADNLTTAQKRLADAQAAGQENTNALQLAVSNAQEKYDGYTKAIQGASGGVVDHTKELKSLQSDLSDVNAALETNAEKHEEATRRILFGILEQQLAMDGMTGQEAKFLTGLAERWGLVDKATADATRSIIDGVTQAESDGSWDALDNRMDYLAQKNDGGPGSVSYAAQQSAGAMAEMADGGVTSLDKTTTHVDDLADSAVSARDRITEAKDALLALPDNKTITITTEHRDNYPDFKPGEGGGGQHFASGGQFHAGQKMVIAEKRREGIVPGFSGTVLSAETLDALDRVLRTLAGTNLARGGGPTAGAPAAGAPGTTVQIYQTFYGQTDPAAAGREAGDAVRRALRAEGRS